MEGKISVGVAGLGYWGSNVARNLDGLAGCRLTWCCDTDTRRLDAQSAKRPDVRVSTDLGELLADPTLDAIAIATPVAEHAAMVQRVLEADKHCFVEKPMARRPAGAKRLSSLAAAKGRVLMVGHLLEYHPAVEALGTPSGR